VEQLALPNANLYKAVLHGVAASDDRASGRLRIYTAQYSSSLPQSCPSIDLCQQCNRFQGRAKGLAEEKIFLHVSKTKAGKLSIASTKKATYTPAFSMTSARDWHTHTHFTASLLWNMPVKSRVSGKHPNGAQSLPCASKA
jgi:hypothetical protein